MLQAIMDVSFHVKRGVRGKAREKKAREISSQGRSCVVAIILLKVDLKLDEPSEQTGEKGTRKEKGGKTLDNGAGGGHTHREV